MNDTACRWDLGKVQRTPSRRLLTAKPSPRSTDLRRAEAPSPDEDANNDETPPAPIEQEQCGQKSKPAPSAQEPPETTTRPARIGRSRKAPPKVRYSSDEEADVQFMLRTAASRGAPETVAPAQTGGAKKKNVFSDDSDGDQEELGKRVPALPVQVLASTYRESKADSKRIGASFRGQPGAGVPQGHKSIHDANNDKQEEAVSSDDDINVLIDNELNKRIAAIAGGGSFRVRDDASGDGSQQENGATENEASDTESDQVSDWVSTSVSSLKNKTPNVSKSLKHLLTKIQSGTSDPGGFNDIIKDAIQDKLRRTKGKVSPPIGVNDSNGSGMSDSVQKSMLHIASDYFLVGPNASPNKQETSDTTSGFTPARRNLFSAEAYIPAQSPLEKESPPRNRPQRKNKSPFEAKRGFFEGKASRSERVLRPDREFNDIRFDESMKRYTPRHDSRTTLRLIRYFEAQLLQHDWDFFLTTWCVPSSCYYYQLMSVSEFLKLSWAREPSFRCFPELRLPAPI